MGYKPHRLEPNYPGPEVVMTKSPAPPVVVERWCGLVERINRLTLDRFTRDIWKRLDPKDLEPLKWANLRATARAGDTAPPVAGPRATPR